MNGFGILRQQWAAMRDRRGVIIWWVNKLYVIPDEFSSYIALIESELMSSSSFEIETFANLQILENTCIVFSILQANKQ